MYKKRLFKVIFIFLTLLLIGKISVDIISKLHYGIPCIFHKITGLQCPGCGNTRAVIAIYKGHFKQAFKYNSLIFFELAYILWLFVNISIKYIKTGKYSVEAKPEFINIIALLIIILWGIIRNIIKI